MIAAKERAVAQRRVLLSDLRQQVQRASDDLQSRSTKYNEEYKKYTQLRTNQESMFQQRSDFVNGQQKRLMELQQEESELLHSSTQMEAEMIHMGHHLIKAQKDQASMSTLEAKMVHLERQLETEDEVVSLLEQSAQQSLVDCNTRHGLYAEHFSSRNALTRLDFNSFTSSSHQQPQQSNMMMSKNNFMGMKQCTVAPILLTTTQPNFFTNKNLRQAAVTTEMMSTSSKSFTGQLSNPSTIPAFLGCDGESMILVEWPERRKK